MRLPIQLRLRETPKVWIAFICAAAALLCGCMKRVAITYEGAKIESSQPASGAVAPFPKDESEREVHQRNGIDYLAVFVSTDADLARIVTAKNLDHVYYRLTACGMDPKEYDLCTGDVFEVSSDEIMTTREREQSRRLYSLYLPLDYAKIRRCAAVIGARNLAEVLDAARSQGLCVDIGAGNMLGSGFSTNLVRIPAVMEGESIQVRLDSP